MLLFMETVSARREQRPVAFALGRPADKQTLAIYSLIHVSPRASRAAQEKSHAAGASRENRSSAQIYCRSNRICGNYFGPSAPRKISWRSVFFADGGKEETFLRK
jgi:hypothetical protein